MAGETVSPSAGRTLERLRSHYEIERELADKLRRATRQERQALYGQVYNELFERVPDHPQLTRKDRAESQAQNVTWRMRLLERFLGPGVVFLELGPGDCALALAVARRTKRVFAVDVSSHITQQQAVPPNFELVLTDGTRVPVPAGAADLAFSDQLMEHLHPDDAAEQLGQVFAALAPGGRYLCITPNRLSGPHDVSKFFDDEATGFHLKEYTVGELAALFRQVGFARVEAYACIRRNYWRCPWVLVRGLEIMLGALPRRLSRRLGRTALCDGILGVIIVGHKPR